MNAPALPVVARVGVAAGWHASASTSAPAVGHLLPTTWAADGRTTRPALCGQRRMRWVSTVAVARKWRPCDRCLAIAEQKPAIGAVVRIAPAAPRAEQLVGRVSDPHVPSTLHDRLARRCAFRDSFWPSDRAVGYVADQLARLRDRERAAAAAFGVSSGDLTAGPGEPDVLDEQLTEDLVDDEIEGLAQLAEREAEAGAVEGHDAHRPLAYSTST